MNIQWIGANSANYQKGRNGVTISKIVLHWIVGKLAAADATFQDSKRVASAHYGIGNTVVHQYVDDENTAYHAGNLTVNRQSLGIEHEGGPEIPISDLTYKTSAQLVADLCRKYAIPIDRIHIIKHSEVPRATQCPGTLDVDRIVSMASAIVAPIMGGDMIPVDKTKFEDFERIKNIYNQIRAKLDVEDSETVVLGELDKLIDYEGAVIQKDRQIQEATAKAGELESKLAELQGKYDQAVTEARVLTEKATKQEQTIQMLNGNMESLGSQIEELKKQSGLPVFRGWKKAVVDLIRKL